MSRMRSAPEPNPDHRLDPYRRAVGVLRSGDRVVGQLALRSDVTWKVRGWWPRRSYQDPAEILDWFIVFEPGEVLAHPDGWNDGLILTHELDEALAHLDLGMFRYRGEELSVHWLTTELAEKVLSDLQW